MLEPSVVPEGLTNVEEVHAYSDIEEFKRVHLTKCFP